MTRGALATLAAVVFAAPAASANHGFDISGDYIVAGFDLGLTLDDDVGALLGVEVTVVELDRDSTWGGVLLAGAWLGDRDAWRLTVGAEAGYGFVGLEAGISVDTAAEVGLRARAFATIGPISAYAGVSTGPGTRGELGLLLKAPIPL